MKTFKDMFNELAANAVGGGGVDFNPTGAPARDKRKKNDTERMYRRSIGLESIRRMLKKRRAE